MEHKNDSVGALSVQLSMACIFCTLVYWFSAGGQAGLIYPMALIPYAPALYGLNRLFLRRERSVRALVLLNLSAGVAFFAALVPAIGWGEWGALAFAAVLCLWLTAQGGWLAVEPPALPRVILCLDVSLVVLILFVAYGSAVQVPAYQLIPACVGCAGSLLGLMIRRIGGGLGARGWSFVGAAFLVVLALVFLLVGVAAAPAGQGVVALWGALTAAARFAAALLWQILVWISSLFPPPSREGEMEMDPVQIELHEEAELAEANPIVMAVLAVLLIAGMLFLVVWGLRMLGRIRIGGVKAARTVRPRRKRLSLLAGLRRLLASWAAYFRLRAWLFHKRNTPEGLFYLLVRQCRMAPWHKRRGETPREFLLRLRRSAGGDPELAAALDELIPAVDAALYAPPGRAGRAAHAGLIRRRIGASARRQFVRDGLDRLPWRKNREAARAPLFKEGSDFEEN